MSQLMIAVSVIPTQRQTPARAGWVVRRCGSHEEMEAIHLQEWQAVSAAERMTAAWEMVQEAWKMKRRNPDELRFQRCVTRLA